MTRGGASGAVDASSSGPDGGSQTDGAEGGSAEPTYTYYRDIEPVLNRRCVPCHQPDSVGPFGLRTYEEAYDHRALVAVSVEGGLMPPMPASDEDCHPLDDFRTMSAQEREMIAIWVDEGAPRGEPSDAPLPPEPDPNVLGEPDAIYDSGVDFMRCEWDNSAENQPTFMGEKQVPKDTWWGFGARDEMCVGSIIVTDEP